jgi:hypothetical protein
MEMSRAIYADRSFCVVPALREIYQPRVALHNQQLRFFRWQLVFLAALIQTFKSAPTK